MLLASAAVAAGVAKLTFGSDPSPSDAPAAIHAPPPEVHAVPAAQAATFAILRAPLRRADAFRQLHPGAGPLGADPLLARTAAVPAHPGGVVPRLVSVVPANGAVCLRILESADEAQWWCLPTAAAARGRLFVALLAPGRVPVAASRQFVVGLVPDGVSSVTIASRDGAGHKVLVRRNVYVTALYAPDRITLRLPGRGSVSYGLRD